MSVLDRIFLLLKCRVKECRVSFVPNYFYFIIHDGRENIVLRSNFRALDFDGFARFEIP